MNEINEEVIDVAFGNGCNAASKVVIPKSALQKQYKNWDMECPNWILSQNNGIKSKSKKGENY